MSTTIQVRTDPALKKDVQLILSGLGLDLSTAINMYLSQIRQTGGIPFNVVAEKRVQQTVVTPKASRVVSEQKAMLATAAAEKAKAALVAKTAPRKMATAKKKMSPVEQKKSFWTSILG